MPLANPQGSARSTRSAAAAENAVRHGCVAAAGGGKADRDPRRRGGGAGCAPSTPAAKCAGGRGGVAAPKAGEGHITDLIIATDIGYTTGARSTAAGQGAGWIPRVARTAVRHRGGGYHAGDTAAAGRC